MGNVWAASKTAYLASFNAVLATCMQPLALQDFLGGNEFLKSRVVGRKCIIWIIMMIMMIMMIIVTTFDAMQSFGLVLLLADNVDGCSTGLGYR